VSVVLKLTPIGTSSSLPSFKNTYALEHIDVLLTSDVYQVKQGELADLTAGLEGYKLEALKQKEAATKQASTKIVTDVKSAAMPPPSNKKAAEKGQTVAPPPPPAAGTPAPAPPANVADVVESVKPIDEKVTADVQAGTGPAIRKELQEVADASPNIVIATVPKPAAKPNLGF
jgi:hypothetical protein